MTVADPDRQSQNTPTDGTYSLIVPHMTHSGSTLIVSAVPPHPDRTTSRGVRLAVELRRPEVAAYRRAVPEQVRAIWDRVVAASLPASDLAVYAPEVAAVLTEALYGHDGFVDPGTGLIALIDQPDDPTNMIRVLLHEVAHLYDGSPVPYTVEEWYAAEARANRAVLSLARRLSVDDPLLPSILAHERRALATQRRWLTAAGQAAGSLRLPLAESVLQHTRTLGALLGDSERTALAKLYLRPGQRKWLLDLPRSALRSFWAPGEADPLAEPVGDHDGAEQDDELEIEAEELWADEAETDSDADQTGDSSAPVGESPNDVWGQLDDLSWEDMEADIWAIPPDHLVFSRGDDRDDGDLSAQRHASPTFRFGAAWNDLISDRRRASLLAFVSRRLTELSAPPSWTVLAVGDETVAAAYMLVSSAHDLVQACAYLQSALLDQHIDATATAVWSIYTAGDDPACEPSWYRLRMTFTGNVTNDWPPVVEVWIAMWDDYPGFLVAALQSFMAGWSQQTMLCPVFASIKLQTPPSRLLARDSRLSSLMSVALGRWLDEQHDAALRAAHTLEEA